MNNNRLILIVAISFSLLVNIPRIFFLFAGSDTKVIFDVSIQDTFFRILSLFGFCYVILKLNIDGAFKWFSKNTVVKSLGVSFLILVAWMGLFRSRRNFNTAQTTHSSQV